LLVEARLEADPITREIILPAAVQWRFDPDGAFGPAIVADITVPERRQTIRLSIRNNADEELAASHIIEIVSEPPTIPGRRIVTIPVVSSKQGRYARGTRLIGAAATVAEGRFWFALSSERFDVNANRNLLRDGKVLELWLTYDTGRLALLVLDIGTSGKRVFEEAAALWAE
jgi:hypothetical protein